jgi:hypothetical protein
MVTPLGTARRWELILPVFEQPGWHPDRFRNRWSISQAAVGQRQIAMIAPPAGAYPHLLKAVEDLAV